LDAYVVDTPEQRTSDGARHAMLTPTVLREQRSVTQPLHAAQRTARALTSIWFWPAVGIIAAAIAGWVFGAIVAIMIGACVIALVAGTGLGLAAAVRPREGGGACAAHPAHPASSHERHTSLQGANLRNAILTRANLQKADLRGAELTGANLEGADLRDANLAPLPSPSAQE